MKMKYKVSFRNESNGFVVWANKKEFYTTVYEHEIEAIRAALLREGQELAAKMDDIQTRLESVGAVDASDPYGWKC